MIDLRTLRPIDYDTVLASVKKTNRCVTVEEGFPVGSIGDHLVGTIMQRAFDYLDAPVITCTGKDVPMPYAANLEKLALITTAEVVDGRQIRLLPLRRRAMAIQILMPALSPTMEEGTLAKWLVKEGDAVKSGQILAEIETDKATMEFEAVDEGIVGKLLVAEGTAGVKVNTPIAVLLEEGENAAAAPMRSRSACRSAEGRGPGAAHRRRGPLRLPRPP